MRVEPILNAWQPLVQAQILQHLVPRHSSKQVPTTHEKLMLITELKHEPEINPKQ